MPATNLLRHVAQRALRVRRSITPSTRTAFAAYQSASAQRRLAFGLKEAEWSAVAISSLRSAVRYAAELPFWTDRMKRAGLEWRKDFTPSDFAALPPLERDEIADAGQALLHPAVPTHLRRKMATGGSSGTPTVVWTGPRERGWGESGIEYFEDRCRITRQDRRALLWGHNLDPVARDTTREKIEDWVLNRTWLDCFRLSPDVLSQYHRSLQRDQPAVMTCYASALVSLAQCIVEQELDAPVYPTKCFITGAEKLFSHERALIERVFRRPVFEQYGGRDLGLIAFQEDPSANTLLVDWPNVYAEPEVLESDSSLLITKLHADAMPLLRYRSGDVVRLAAQPMSHGPLFRINEVLGRELQRIFLPTGGWMHGTVVPHLMKDFDVQGYQLRQTADGGLHLLLVPRSGFTPEQEDLIVNQLAMNLGGLRATVQHVSDIPRTPAGKLLPVISEFRTTGPDIT